MTEEDINFDKRQISENNQEQKKTARKYWENQNLKRGSLAIIKPLIGQVNEIKKTKGFKNDSEAIEYLLEIEQSVRSQNGIVEYRACEKCGVPIDVKLDSYEGITHRHVDSKSNCFGCITTKYRVKTKVEVLPGTIETKTEQTEQPKQKEIESTREMIPYSD